MNNQHYIWYVGYGSNLSKQRFLCYIVGGTPKYGKEYNDGCRNTNCPVDDKPFKIPCRLYFALPNGNTETSNWGPGGVAFIIPDKDLNENNRSLARMWKITKEQYEEIRNQEGCCWYNFEISLGEENGISIYTVTNENYLGNIKTPSEAYLKTIALGLKETYRLTVDGIADYLMQKDGIKDYFKKDKLIKVFSVSDCI